MFKQVTNYSYTLHEEQLQSAYNLVFASQFIIDGIPCDIIIFWLLVCAFFFHIVLNICNADANCGNQVWWDVLNDGSLHYKTFFFSRCHFVAGFEFRLNNMIELTPKFIPVLFRSGENSSIDANYSCFQRAEFSSHFVLSHFAVSLSGIKTPDVIH